MSKKSSRESHSINVYKQKGSQKIKKKGDSFSGQFSSLGLLRSIISFGGMELQLQMDQPFL